jgi:hypothetical protein
VKSHHYRRFGHIALCASLIASSPGCTAIGAGVGALIRTPARDARPGPPAEAIRVKAGDVVLLRLRDGRTLSGTFESLHSRSGSEYEPLYLACQRTSGEGRLLPDLGRVRLRFGDRREAEDFDLVGFEEAGVVVRKTGGEASLVTFARTRSLMSREQPVDIKSLERLVAAGSVPSLSEVRLRGVMEGIGLNEVTSLEYRPRRGHALIGAGVGLVLDLLTIVLIGYAALHW